MSLSRGGKIRDNSVSNRASGYAESSTPTDRRYTGQVKEDIGLYFYNARWYDTSLGRFIQSDHLVPEPLNPLSFDRYAYVFNNSLNMIDPSGLYPCNDDDDECKPNLKWKGILGHKLEEWEILLLIMTVMAESMRASLPDAMIAGIAWTYLNRLTLGEFDKMQYAIAGNQSGFTGAYQQRYMKPGETLAAFVTRFWESVKNDPKWQKIEGVVRKVYDQWLRFGTGSDMDPTNGADSFVMKQPLADLLNKPLHVPLFGCAGNEDRCDRKIRLAIRQAEQARQQNALLNNVENAFSVYPWRADNNQAYHFVVMGPVSASGLTITIFFDNRLQALH